MKCPKCHEESGDSWIQCDGVCPMPMSPHYQPALDRWGLGGDGDNGETLMYQMDSFFEGQDAQREGS